VFELMFLIARFSSAKLSGLRSECLLMKAVLIESASQKEH